MPNSSDYVNRPFLRRIFNFNEQVVGVETSGINPLNPSEAGWLQQALTEEAEELVDAGWTYDEGYPDAPGSAAHRVEDPRDIVVGQVDACVDAMIFAIGGLRRIGLSVEQAHGVIHAVMDANFEKKAGVKEGREGAKDAVKPEGWVGPEERIWEILYGQ